MTPYNMSHTTSLSLVLSPSDLLANPVYSSLFQTVFLSQHGPGSPAWQNPFWNRIHQNWRWCESLAKTVEHTPCIILRHISQRWFHCWLVCTKYGIRLKTLGRYFVSQKYNMCLKELAWRVSSITQTCWDKQVLLVEFECAPPSSCSRQPTRDSREMIQT